MFNLCPILCITVNNVQAFMHFIKQKNPEGVANISMQDAYDFIPTQSQLKATVSQKYIFDIAYIYKNRKYFYFN